MKDQTYEKVTGRDLPWWMALLQECGAQELSHREIAELVLAEFAQLEGEISGAPFDISIQITFPRLHPLLRLFHLLTQLLISPYLLSHTNIISRR